MRIKGMDWMEWLHRVRKASQRQRKSSRRSLAKYLKQLEGKASLKGKEPRELSRAIQEQGESSEKQALVIEELEDVILTCDLPGYGLARGDIGTVVLVHKEGKG